MVFWGSTQALDLVEEYSKYHKLPAELDILVIGGGDARHILKTLSKLYSHNRVKKLRLYVHEACLEQVARQLLLLSVALDSNDKLGLSARVRTFMELYGKIFLQ